MEEKVYGLTKYDINSYTYYQLYETENEVYLDYINIEYYKHMYYIFEVPKKYIEFTKNLDEYNVFVIKHEGISSPDVKKIKIDKDKIKRMLLLK